LLTACHPRLLWHRLPPSTPAPSFVYPINSLASPHRTVLRCPICHLLPRSRNCICRPSHPRRRRFRQPPTRRSYLSSWHPLGLPTSPNRAPPLPLLAYVAPRSETPRPTPSFAVPHPRLRHHAWSYVGATVLFYIARFYNILSCMV
jgi:hypothetical protein